MTDVLVVGDAIVDAVFGGVDRYPDPGEEVVAPRFDLRPGGSAGYASAALSELGTDVRVATLVGSGVLSDYWVEFVAGRGVDTGPVQRVAGESVSVATAVLFEEDRAFITHRGATASDRTVLSGSDVAGIDALLVTGFSQAPYLWSEAFVAVVEAAAESGVPVFLDTNWSEGDWQGVADSLLPAVDYLLVNDAEVRRLAGREAVPAAGRELLDRGVEACVVTTGAEGCTLVSQEGVRRVPAATVEAVDSCGAGDFFNAGLVDALCDEAELGSAAAAANRCAGAAVQRFDLREKLAAVGSL
jgi:sugar/nucleoside kinase (ribokinase family)